MDDATCRRQQTEQHEHEQKERQPTDGAVQLVVTAERMNGMMRPTIVES